jgi:hypothetical protein
VAFVAVGALRDHAIDALRDGVGVADDRRAVAADVGREQQRAALVLVGVFDDDVRGAEDVAGVVEREVDRRGAGPARISVRWWYGVRRNCL